MRQSRKSLNVQLLNCLLVLLLFPLLYPIATYSEFIGHPISLDLQDTDVDNFVRIIAEVSKLNAVMMHKERKKITYRTLDTPWDEAFSTGLAKLGQKYVREGNILKIYKQDSAPRVSKVGYHGRLISLDLQDTDFENALRIISEVSDKKMPDPESYNKRSKITVRLIDVPWDQALDLMAEVAGYVASMQEDQIALKSMTSL